MPLPLLPLLAALVAVPEPGARDGVQAVDGGSAAPAAWLALWRGEAWVCWDAGTPSYWQRLELAGIVDVATLHAEFVDRSTLVLGDSSTATWLIVRPDPTPRVAAWSTTPRRSPQTFGCGPSGVLPVADDAGLRLVTCDAPVTTQCVHPGRPLRLRPVSPLRLRIGLELRALDRWSTGVATSRTTDVQLLATVAVGLDVIGWVSQRRERDDLRAQARPGLRALPTPRSRGPLLATEHRALSAVVCGGGW